MATPTTPEIWNHGIIRVGKDLCDYPVQPLTQQGQGLKCHVPLVLLLGVLVSDMCREMFLPSDTRLRKIFRLLTCKKLFSQLNYPEKLCRPYTVREEAVTPPEDNLAHQN